MPDWFNFPDVQDPEFARAALRLGVSPLDIETSLNSRPIIGLTESVGYLCVRLVAEGPVTVLLGKTWIISTRSEKENARPDEGLLHVLESVTAGYQALVESSGDVVQLVKLRQILKDTRRVAVALSRSESVLLRRDLRGAWRRLAGELRNGLHGVEVRLTALRIEERRRLAAARERTQKLLLSLNILAAAIMAIELLRLLLRR